MSNMIKQFLPRGPIWDDNSDTCLSKVLDSFETEVDRLLAHLNNLITESNPRFASSTLATRELEANLPDPCTGTLTTVQERRNAVVNKWALTGGATIQYLIDAAARQGYYITIEDDLTTHVFTIHSASTTITTFKAGSSVAGEALRTWGTESLECLITRIKPAHTRVLFAYDL